MSKQKSNSGSIANPGEIGGPETTLPGNESEASTTNETENPTPEKKTFSKRTVVSGAEFWEFAPETPGADYNGAVFRGKFCSVVKREKPGANAATDDNHKVGAVIGYNFEQHETGLHFLIGNSHAIQKALESEQFSKQVLWEIEFLGKGVTAGNKPYNRFEVSVLE